MLKTWVTLACSLVLVVSSCKSDDEDDDNPGGDAGETGSSTGGKSSDGGAAGSGASVDGGSAGSVEPGEGEAGGPAAGGTSGGNTGTGGTLASAGAGGSDEPTDGGTGNVSSGGTSAGGTSTAGGSAFPDKWGVIGIDQMVRTYPAPIGTLAASGAVAVFGLRAGDLDDICETTTSGPCQLFICDAGETPEPTPFEYYDGGDVTISGLGDDIPLEHIDDEQSGYISESFARLLWESSTTATVTVTGSDDVPAFSMDLDVPDPLDVTAPAADNSAYTLSRGSALEVTWSGGGVGQANVTISTGDAASGQVSIACYVDAADGGLTVPAAFMAELGASGSFSVGSLNVERKDVGDWLMQFQSSVLLDSGTATFTD